MNEISICTLTVVSINFSNAQERKSYIKFSSAWAAKYMAKKYYECADVQSVEVVDDITGEVYYYHNPKEEWESEE